MLSSSPPSNHAPALIALNFSGFSRDYEAALTVIDGGLTECSKLYEPLLQVIKARLLMGSGSPGDGTNLLANACSEFKRKQGSDDDSRNWVEIEREQQAILCKELTELYLSQDRIKDAEYAVAELERLAPNTTDTLSVTGDVRHAQGRIDQAIQLYEMALSIDPTQEAATLSLGASSAGWQRDVTGGA